MHWSTHSTFSWDLKDLPSYKDLKGWIFVNYGPASEYVTTVTYRTPNWDFRKWCNFRLMSVYRCLATMNKSPFLKKIPSCKFPNKYQKNLISIKIIYKEHKATRCTLLIYAVDSIDHWKMDVENSKYNCGFLFISPYSTVSLYLVYFEMFCRCIFTKDFKFLWRN